VTVVEFRDVSVSFGARPILRGINLAVEQGEILVLLGRSGSGKTTLLKTVNGLVRQTGGEVFVRGDAVSKQDVIALRRRTGYVIQDAGLFPHRTVAENVGLVPRLEKWNPSATKDRVRSLLESVGLASQIYAGRYPRELSGGERQRVGIARALAADPPLLLLDEPFAALDPVTRWELQQLFLALSRNLGKTALFVTHDIREALLMASRIAVLKDGLLECVMPPDEFRHAETPEAAAFLASLKGGSA
jgi:osmoprotectant transport system ATP-binding protein